MTFGGILARIAALVSRGLGRITPTGIGPRFVLTGAVLVLAVAVATADQGRGWIAVAWILCAAAVVLLIGLHVAIKTRFDKVSDSLESIGLGELSGHVGGTSHRFGWTHFRFESSRFSVPRRVTRRGHSCIA